MAKAKTQYACTECGGTSSKWAGQCPACGQWNTMVESVVETAANRFGGQAKGLVQGAPVMRLSDIEALDAGVIEALLVQPGDVVPVGTVIATLADEA